MAVPDTITVAPRVKTVDGHTVAETECRAATGYGTVVRIPAGERIEMLGEGNNWAMGRVEIAFLPELDQEVYFRLAKEGP